MPHCGQGMACAAVEADMVPRCVPAFFAAAGDGCYSNEYCAGYTPQNQLGNLCSSNLCTGAPQGSPCGEGLDGLRSCAAGLYCNSTATTAGTCAPQIPSWAECDSQPRRPSWQEVVGLVEAASPDPCQRGAVCSVLPPQNATAPYAGNSVCVPLGSLSLATVVDVVHAEFRDQESRAPHPHDRNQSAAGINVLCASGYAQASRVGSSLVYTCSVPISPTYFTNNIGQECDAGIDELSYLPYTCWHKDAHLGALAAPWDRRADSATTVLAAAMCRAGDADVNSSATASAGCSRESLFAPGSCMYYNCFDLIAQVSCLSDGLIWDRATLKTFPPGLVSCYQQQVTLPEDVFQCVWAGLHMANCSVLPGIPGSCPYRPEKELSGQERNGITMAIVMGVIGVLITGASGYAVHSTRVKQREERARAWRAGGATLLSASRAGGEFHPMSVEHTTVPVSRTSARGGGFAREA
jgi:hypothetical protein